MAVYRIYVEKKAPYAVEAQQLLHEIRHILLIKSVTGLRIVNRYDVEGIDEALFTRCQPIVFSEPQLDTVSDTLPKQDGETVFAVEFLPGQFDQRAASCEECIQLVSQGERPTVRSARVFLLAGAPTEDELERIKRHVINPVEAREADMALKETLLQQYDAPDHVPTLTGFCALQKEQIADFVKQYGLAMDADDLEFCRQYFVKEQRDPTLTEIRMIDTYWSDHCRHTTFLTTLDDVQIEKPEVERAFRRYLAVRESIGRTKPVTLMDIATIAPKALKKQGLLGNIDESEEINACSIKIDVDVNGEQQKWLLMFKNETHNHPPRSSRLAVRLRASAARYATRSPGAPTCIRPCASPARLIRLCPWRTPCPASCPSASWSPRRLRGTAPTATKSAWPPDWWTRCITRAMRPSGWRSAR